VCMYIFFLQIWFVAISDQETSLPATLNWNSLPFFSTATFVECHLFVESSCWDLALLRFAAGMNKCVKKWKIRGRLSSCVSDWHDVYRCEVQLLFLIHLSVIAVISESTRRTKKECFGDCVPLLSCHRYFGTTAQSKLCVTDGIVHWKIMFTYFSTTGSWMLLVVMLLCRQLAYTQNQIVVSPWCTLWNWFGYLDFEQEIKEDGFIIWLVMSKTLRTEGLFIYHTGVTQVYIRNLDAQTLVR